MATLEKIRGYSVVLVVMIGLALLAFLLGDILRHGRTLNNDSRTNAIVIDGEKVKIHDYQALVDEATEMYKMQAGNASMDEATTNRIRNQVFQTIVAQKVLDAETKKAGLDVSQAELFDLVQGDFVSPLISQSPMFANPETGTFDRAGLLTFLKSISSTNNLPANRQAQATQLKRMWASLENNVQNSKLSEKYTTLVAQALVANKLEVQDELNANATTSNLTYVAQPARLVADSTVTLSKGAVEDFYNAHKEDFKTDKSRILDVIYSTVRPSQSDIESARKDIESARKELIEGVAPADVLSEYSDTEYVDSYFPIAFFRQALPSELVDNIAQAQNGYVSDLVTSEDNTFFAVKLIDTKIAPDSLHVSHIVLEPGTGKADSLLAVLKQSPASFAEVAVANSLDRNSSGNGGEIGWLTEAVAARYIGNDFAKSIFNAKVGEPYKFTSKYGEHLILVDKATTPVKKYLVAVAGKKAEAGNETVTASFNQINNFLSANRNANSIDTAAVNQGFQVVREVSVTGMQEALMPGIEHSRELVRWALENKEGSISDVKECGDKFVIAVIRKAIKRGTMPLDEVKDQIHPYLLAKAKLDRMYDNVKSAGYESLSAFASKIDQPIDTLNYVQFSTTTLAGIGYEPAVSAAAAFAPEGKVVPVKGNNGVYLIQVNNRTETTDKADAETTKARIEGERRNAMRMQLFPQLILKRDIQDNRARFY